MWWEEALHCGRVRDTSSTTKSPTDPLRRANRYMQHLSLSLLIAIPKAV